MNKHGKPCKGDAGRAQGASADHVPPWLTILYACYKCRNTKEATPEDRKAALDNPPTCATCSEAMTMVDAANPGRA